jgi:hypothetical protein
LKVRTKTVLSIAVLAMVALTGTATAQDQPNILVVWGDDIGQSNISAYTRGMMGYETPNIDRIANEGMIFTDYYGEQSCTAGRSSFITGQSVFRTGLSKVGLPGATPPASSARTTSVTRTSSCPPTTALTNSSATSTTSTPRRSPRTKTIRRT